MPRFPKRRRAVLGATLLASTAGLAAADVGAGLRDCARLGGDGDRLACFDRLAAEAAAPSFSGFGGGETPVFETRGPATLVYASEDAVLVIYLLTEMGDLVQNLHMGGVGEARYSLAAPGRYRLQVDATGGWRVRLEEGAP